MDRSSAERRIAIPFPIRAKSASRRAWSAATGTAPAGEPAWATRGSGATSNAKSVSERRMPDLGGDGTEGLDGDLRSKHPKSVIDQLRTTEARRTRRPTENRFLWAQGE